MSDKPSFFVQLKQRKLVQWAVAYVAAAFALLQGIDIVAQRFDWPQQTIRLVILAMIVGFFVTLVLAWYHGERGAQRVSGTELLVIGLVLAVGGGFLWKFAAASHPSDQKTAATLNESRMPEPAQSIPAKSIAVLPFENLNRDPDTDYLCDGIPESVISSLSQLPKLKVMSRNSVFHYKGKEIDPQTVAKELKVGRSSPAGSLSVVMA